MNLINQLLDKNYILAFLTKKLSPHYPNFKITSIKILPHKKYIWSDTYHVVFEFNTKLQNKNKTINIPIFVTAHSSESRRHVCKSLNFLWDSNFSDPTLTIPKPLFYSQKFNGCFYVGVEGINLYQLIRKKDIKTVKKIIPKVALWFSKLHSTPLPKNNFKLKKSTIARVLPGRKHILNTIKTNYPKHLDDYEKIYKILIKNENNHLKLLKKLYVVHGDAHPENIIHISESKLGVIDFTDLCLSDYARDLGTFIQQLEYMSNRKLEDPKLSQELTDNFLKHYIKYAKIKKDSFLEERINNYYNWTSIRTATYFLTQAKLMTQKEFRNKASVLISVTKQRMGIN